MREEISSLGEPRPPAFVLVQEWLGQRREGFLGRQFVIWSSLSVAGVYVTPTFRLTEVDISG